MLRAHAMGAEQLEPGDLITISRGAFQHWAVYICDGYVVHLVTLGSSLVSSTVLGGFVRGQVRKDKLKDVVKEDKWKKNNILDQTYKPRPPREIVKEALSWVGRDMSYSVSSWNCEHFATMCRYGISSSSQGAEQLEPGDLIAISRGAFQHWAVYIGDGYVVHLVAPGSSGASSTVLGGFVRDQVRKDKLKDVVKEDKWQKNNILDQTCKPRPCKEIVREALSWVGRDMSYSVSSWNCEHFATMCRYGISSSSQVLKATGTVVGLAIAAVGGGIVAGTTGAAAVVAGGIFIMRKKLIQAL